MKNFILILAFFLIATNAWCQWFYGSGKAVNLENDIGYNKNTQLIKSGVTSDPQTASVSAGAGSLILKTDGQLYVKKDAGLTTNWKKVLDESFNVASLIPTATSTQTGLLSSSDWTIFNNKQNALGFIPEQQLTFSSPLSRLANTVSIPVATTATSGYLTFTDWNTFNGKQNALGFTPEQQLTFNSPLSRNVNAISVDLSSKQDALGFTPENVANKSTLTTLGSSDTLYPSQKAVKTYVDTSIGAIPTVHNDLSGLQGGTTGEYYHNTSNQNTVMGDLSHASNTITASQSLNITQTSKLANEYLVASNKVDGSFESGTTSWATSTGTIVRTANTATTTISGNYNGVWSGTGTATLDLQWTATASNTYEPSVIVQLPTGQTVSNYTICAVVNGVETGCKVLDYCQLDRQCKVSVVADSVLGSSFYLRLKHTGSGAFFAIVDSGKIEAWTPNLANSAEIQSYYSNQASGPSNDSTGPSGAQYLLLYEKTSEKTGSIFAVSQVGTHTRITLLKKAKIDASYSLIPDANNPLSLIKNGAIFQRSSSDNTINYGQYSGTDIGEVGDYYEFAANSFSSGANSLSFSAISVSPHIVQSYQDGMATWSATSTIQIGATTTAPTKGTADLDQVRYMKGSGSEYQFWYQYNQTAAGGGAVGSGDYLFTLPNGLQFDSNKVTFYTDIEGSGTWRSKNAIPAGAGFWGTNYNTSLYIIPYDATRFRVGFIGGSSSSPILGVFSNSETIFTSSASSFSLKFSASVLGASASPTLLALPTRSEIFSANVDATETITNATQNFVTSCTNAAPSVCTLWSNFGVAPICFAQKTSSSDAYVSASTTTSVTVQRADASTPFNLFCHLK